MTKWIVVAIVVALVLFAAIRGCGDEPLPTPGPITTDTLHMSRVDTVVVSQTDTVRIVSDAEPPCPQFSINRASYTCR